MIALYMFTLTVTKLSGFHCDIKSSTEMFEETVLGVKDI